MNSCPCQHRINLIETLVTLHSKYGDAEKLVHPDTFSQQLDVDADAFNIFPVPSYPQLWDAMNSQCKDFMC